MFYKIIIILLELGFGITFNIVGTISLSELLLVLFIPFYFKLNLFAKFPQLKTITWIYLGLLVSQILSEIVIGNTLNSAIKGFAVTIMSYLHVLFLFNLFTKNRKLVIYAIIGALLKSLIFKSQYADGGDVSGVIQGEGATFLKFYLAPIIINVLLVSSIYIKKKIGSYLFIVIGLFFVILGARSAGLGVLLTGILTYFVLSFKGKLKTKKIFFIGLLFSLFFYGFYVTYVNNVLSGDIKAGNSKQIKELKDPYNPFNLLIMGRTETFVGAIAFMDKPFFGHGAWATDVTGKYRLLIFKLRDENFREIEKDIIPSHSVFIGAGMRNGIFAFLFMGFIIFYFIKKGAKSITKKDTYILISVNFIFFIFWNGFFSPVSHFRQTLPLPFAFLLASYSVNVLKIKYLKNKHNQLNKHYK
jgi:hypothetical protein